MNNNEAAYSQSSGYLMKLCRSFCSSNLLADTLRHQGAQPNHKWHWFHVFFLFSVTYDPSFLTQLFFGYHNSFLPAAFKQGPSAHLFSSKAISKRVD
jgi:hypothetical protein